MPLPLRRVREALKVLICAARHVKMLPRYPAATLRARCRYVAARRCCRYYCAYDATGGRVAAAPPMPPQLQAKYA